METLHPNFTEEGKEEKPFGYVGVSTGRFLWNPGQRLWVPGK